MNIKGMLKADMEAILESLPEDVNTQEPRKFADIRPGDKTYVLKTVTTVTWDNTAASIIFDDGSTLRGSSEDAIYMVRRAEESE